MDIHNRADLESALNGILDNIRELQAENLVAKTLLFHSIGLLARRSENPTKVFEQIRSSSLANMTERVAFAGGDPQGNERMVARAREIHEQMFEALKRAVVQQAG